MQAPPAQFATKRGAGQGSSKARYFKKLLLSRHWNVPIKAIFSQAAGHFTQMAVCFQSVDEVSLTKYDEDTIKQ